MPPRPLAALLALCGLVLTGAAACSGSGAGGQGPDGKLNVVTAFYPLEFLSTRIGGDAVTVSQLTKPGAEPHDLELTARQVGSISDAGLVVYLKGFQPAVDDAVEQEAKDRAFDAGTAVDLLPVEEHSESPGEGEEHAEAAGGKDPHVWLDPMRFATIGDKLAERFAAADPANAAGYTERAKALHAELDTLHQTYTAQLRSCTRKEIVTSHAAFHYLAERYGLTEIGITGVSPDAEATTQRLAEVAKEAKALGTTTIFFETLVSPKVAETIAREVGAQTAVLDPIEGLTAPGSDYFSVMRTNLSALSEALGCSA